MPCRCGAACIARPSTGLLQQSYDNSRLSLPVMQRLILSVVAAGVLAPAAEWASAQNYPVRPVRLVTAEPGGGVDFAARLVAQGLSANLGQQVIVDNRGGASGVIAGEIVAKAPPDPARRLHLTVLWQRAMAAAIPA